MQKFQNNVQDQFGNEIKLPTITVKNVVGGALSTLFSDDGVTPLANPFIAQDLSEFFFYASNNRYDIFITGPVIDSFLDVLLFDPADGGVDASTARTGNFLFDADVTGVDPQTNSIKFNSVTPASITSCRIALTDIDNLSIADLTALSLVGSRMRVWDELDPTQLQEFVVRTVPALDVDHFEFTVDFIAGTASMSADDKRLRVQFELTSFLGAGITSGDQNSTLFWDTDRQWTGTDNVQVNPSTPEVGGRIRSPGSGVTDVSRAMVFHNVGNSIGGTLYAETEANQGFYLFADFNGVPRTWEFGYDSGVFNGILAFEDSPLGIVVFGAARYLQGEKSAAAADVVGFGQWWVRDDVPNTPMYTDDAGNDFELNADTSGGLPGVNGAKAFGSANQAIATGPGLTAVALNSEAYDTDSIHDLVTNNSRLTVPAGIGRIRLSGYVKWQPNGSSFRILKITKNGALGTIDDDQAGYEPDMFTSAANASVPDVGVFIDSGIIRAVATDFFELEVSQESGVSLNLLAGDYWFQMDLIEESLPPTGIIIGAATAEVQILNLLGTTSFSLPVHNNGDILVMGHYVSANDIPADEFLIVTAGWTQLAAAALEVSGGIVRTQRVWTKVGDGVETEVLVNNDTEIARTASLGIIAFSGVDAAIWDVTPTGSHRKLQLTSSNPTATAITTLTDGAVVLLFCSHQLSFSTYAPPIGYTDDANASGNSVYVCTKKIAIAGLETPGAWQTTGVGSSADNVIMTLTLAPAP